MICYRVIESITFMSFYIRWWHEIQFWKSWLYIKYYITTYLITKSVINFRDCNLCRLILKRKVKSDSTSCQNLF